MAEASQADIIIVYRYNAVCRLSQYQNAIGTRLRALVRREIYQSHEVRKDSLIINTTV